MTHPGGGGEEFYSVQGAGNDQFMDNSWMGCHQGEVLNIIKYLVSTSLEFMFLWSAVSIWGRGACVLQKKLRNMCQGGYLYLAIYIFQGTGSLMNLLCDRIIV